MISFELVFSMVSIISASESNQKENEYCLYVLRICYILTSELVSVFSFVGWSNMFDKPT